MIVRDDGTLYNDDYHRIQDIGELIKDILDNSDHGILGPDRLEDLMLEMESIVRNAKLSLIGAKNER